MPWKHKEEPVAVPCTTAIVKEFAELEGVPHDRPFSESRATFIKREIMKNTFRVAGFASVYCRETKKTYRVNGKHTALVLGDLNGRYPKGLFAFIERYTADTLKDVARLYASYDHRRSIRSSGDINRIFVVAHPELADVAPKIANVCASGLGFAKWEYESVKREAEERAVLLTEHPEFVAWVSATFGGTSRYRALLRGPVVAAMFRTFDKSRRAAAEFWSLVAEESHASNKHPSRVLARWLLTHGLYKGASRSISENLDSVRGMYCRCLIAWNAWREGKEEVTLRFQPSQETPSVL